MRERYNPNPTKKKEKKKESDETVVFKDDEKKDDAPLDQPVRPASKWANIYASTAKSVTDVVNRKVEKLQPGNEKKPDKKRDFKKGNQNQGSKKNYTIGNAKFDVVGGR